MVKDTYTFENEYKVKISLTDNPNKIIYRFFNDDGDEIQTIESGYPTHVTKRSELVRQIKNCIEGKVAQRDLDKILIKLNKIVSALQGAKEMEYVQQKQEIDLQIRKKAHKAQKFMETLEEPLLYIGSVIDWLTAGERINTLICFCAGCSQIILKEPISVIGYGESSSGKTHIQRTALSLLPDEFIEVEKKVSPAALFNRAAQDTCFYDGKIVSYGDMGGQNDRENMQEALDLMKELQTDGFLKKPVSVKQTDGKWGVEDLILEGRPSLWYTTVPAHIDNQELSRAVVYSPRTNNKSIFHKRGKVLSLTKGKTHKKFEKIEKESEIIKHMVLHLRTVMEDYIIIDPYYEIIADLLDESKFYKRDTEKILNLLDTITAINFYSNPKYVFDDGQHAVITSKNDVQLLLSLLKPYMSSIAVNIKPKSVEVYEFMQEHIGDWKLVKGADDEGYNSAGWKVGITIQDYFERSDKTIPLSSLRMYFQDLREAGLLTVVGKEGKSNLYDVIDYDFHDALHEFDFSSIVENVEVELGSDIAEIIRNDVVNEDLSILNKHSLVEDTVW